MLVSRTRIGFLVGSIATLMAGLLVLHLSTEIATSFLSLFPQQIVIRVVTVVLIGLPVCYLLQRREREEEIQQRDEGWAAHLHARSEELLAVNNALVSEVSKRIDTNNR